MGADSRFFRKEERERIVLARRFVTRHDHHHRVHSVPPLSYKYNPHHHRHHRLSLRSNPFALPNRRTKEPARSVRVRIRNLHGRIQIIHIVIRDANPPPRRHARIRQIDRQDDDNGADSQSGIQPGRSDVVETHPPPSVLVPDVLVEDVAHDPPREVVERCSRRDLSTAAEDERSGEIAPRAAGKCTRERVKEDRSGHTGEPEILEVGVDGSGGEDALRTDETPDDGGVEKDPAVRAIELVGLVFGADVGNGAAESPLEDGDLDDAGPDGGDSLGHEHGTPWNLHVLA